MHEVEGIALKPKYSCGKYYDANNERHDLYNEFGYEVWQCGVSF